MPILDPEKRRAYRRDWYSKNKISEKKHVKKRKVRIRKWINNYKSQLKCETCSESHPSTIDFHHVSGKDFEIGYMVSNGYSTKRIQKELEKCKVLCSNCHRKEHYRNHNL